MSAVNQLFNELARRDLLVKAIEEELFPEQLGFINDQGRFKAAQCTRRSGKSFTAGADLIRDMILYPGCNVLFIATTLKQAKRILLKDIVKVIARKHKIPLKPNMTEGYVTHAVNGSVLYCMGMDSDKNEADKILGLKFRKVYVDEAASYKQDLRHIVYSSIIPTLADQNGSLCMIGTTGNNTNNMFYDITNRSEGDPQFVSGFSLHKWTWKENPHTRDAVEKLINKLKLDNPYVDQTPWFRQMYLNEWVVEDDRLVYKYKDDRNFVPMLPPEHIWRFSITVDLGFDDDTAFVIGAWSDTDPNMYFVEAYKKKNMDITQVANQVKAYESRFKFTRYVVDGSNAQAVAEMVNRFKIPFEASDKRGKSDIIEIMNGDLIMGRIKVLPAANCIIDEWRKLIWDAKKSVRVEDSKLPNHASDAALYCWRMCYHYQHKISEPVVEKYSDTWLDQYAKKREKQILGDKKTPWFVRDWKQAFRLK